MLFCEGHAFGHRTGFVFQGLELFLDNLTTAQQAVIHGDLDIQARTGIQLQHHRTMLVVHHQIHPQIAQPGQVVATGRQLQAFLPVRHGQPGHRVGGIRVTFNFQVVPGAIQRNPGRQIQAHADGALVQVRLALGLPGGQAQHGRHRVTLEHDDADIRHTFEADPVEQFGGTHPVFDQCLVAMTAEGIDTGNDPGDMVLQLFGGNDASGSGAEIILEAIGNHHDAVTAGPLRGLDYEIPVLLHYPVQGADTLLGGDGAVHVRHTDSRIQRHLLGLNLVVHQRVQAALVITQDVIAIALINAHDATGAQGLAGFRPEHQRLSPSTMARNRNSSVRR